MGQFHKAFSLSGSFVKGILLHAQVFLCQQAHLASLQIIYTQL